MMPIDESNDSQPRKSWLKSHRLWCVGYIITGLVVGVLALRFAWGLVAEHRLSALIASYRAEGGPVTVDDFNAELDRVPDDENAALLYEKAFDMCVSTSQAGKSIRDLLYELEMFAANASIVDELMEANAAVLAMLREARDMSFVAWPERLGVVKVNTNQFSAQVMLAYVLWFATYYHFQNGDHDEAIETLRDLERFCDTIDSNPEVPLSQLSWALREFTFIFVERYGSDLLVEADEKSTNVQSAAREQIEKLIRELFDEQGLREAAIRSYLGGRAETLNYYSKTDYPSLVQRKLPVIVDQTPTKQVLTFMMHSSLVLDSIRQAEFDTCAVNAVSAYTWPEASRLFPDMSVTPSILTFLTRPIACNNLWGCSYKTKKSSVQRFFKTLSRRRMTAIALAIRLYTVDHGFRPADLIELVPRYLPSLPPDPFADGVASFGYRPNADRPFLYSIGLDGKDDEGKKALEPGGWGDSERSDIVFYLEPEPVASSPSEANDDDEDVEHEQGDQTEHDAGESQPYKR